MHNKKKKSPKIIFLISSFMHGTEITDENPNVIRCYNITKGGTDNDDKPCHSNAVSGRSYRWTLRSSYRMLDQAVVNVRILLVCGNKINNVREK